MNGHPDAAWRLKWLQSKDGLEIEAWAVGGLFAQAVNEVLQPGDQEYRLTRRREIGPRAKLNTIDCYVVK